MPGKTASTSRKKCLDTCRVLGSEKLIEDG